VVNTSGSSWVLPTSPYDVASLENGTTQALYALASIKAIRLGLIMRTNVAEKTAVTTAPLTLFSDLGSALTYTRTLTSGEQNYRYRTIEATIPLRNSLMLSSQ
jgi:type IV pilus assembly protein PilW